MMVFHMRNIESENDAYVVATNLVEATVLYEKSYSCAPDFVFRLDGNISKLIVEVEHV